MTYSPENSDNSRQISNDTNSINQKQKMQKIVAEVQNLRKRNKELCWQIDLGKSQMQEVNMTKDKLITKLEMRLVQQEMIFS